MKIKTIILGAILATVCMYGANALTEAECDVTPGMNWDGAACMDAAGGQNGAEFKEGKEYVVYRYGVEQTYNGHIVDPGVVDWFQDAKKVLKKENNINLSEIHSMCANNRMPDFHQVGNPEYSKTGNFCWCRIKTDKKISDWIFGYNHHSSKSCAIDCVSHCADGIAMYSFVRDPLLSTLK